MAENKKAPSKPSKKRASSPAKGTRFSKRLKVPTPKVRPTISTIPTQEGSALLNLPREIRNNIYIKLLTGVNLTFRMDKLIVVATQDPDGLFRHSKPGARGLPLWMLSCQQICHELLDIIARTHTFQPCGRPKNAEGELEGVPNSLIFADGGIRNILMIPNFDSGFHHGRNSEVIGDQAIPFLKLMDSLFLKDAVLELAWSHNYRRQQWSRNEPAKFTAEWGEVWYGRFRKVKITIAVIQDPENGGTPLWIMDEAEKCAAILVGAGASVSWESLGRRIDLRRSGKYSRSQPTVWVRRVTVERKV
jgi:hypothetical protein